MVGNAWAESRVALVIGNSDYRSASRLANPANDAKAISTALQAVDFEVQTVTDLTRLNMGRALSTFANTVAAKGKDTVALVFYAGHGLQIEGENYLVPTDANIEREADVPLGTMRLADVMKALESIPTKSRIVILDACRNNPFAGLQKTTGRGLAVADAPAGSILAYSTSPGQEALDGTGANSPYTSALVEVMKEPGLPIEAMFRKVRVKVNEATSGRQVPWESTSLTVNFAFAPGLNPLPAIAANPPANPGVQLVSAGGNDRPVQVPTGQPQDFSGASRQRVSDIARRPVDEAYQIAIEENSIEAFEAYLDAFAEDARAAQIKRLLVRRNQMFAWRNAVVSNDPEAYEAYLSLYPDSDNAAAASRLRERPRFRPIDPVIARPVFLPLSNRIKFGNGGGFANGGGFGNGQVFNGINQALNRLGGTRGGNLPLGSGRFPNGGNPLGNVLNGGNRGSNLPGGNGAGFPNGGLNSGQNNGGRGNGPLGPQAGVNPNGQNRPSGINPTAPLGGQNGQSNQNGQNKAGNTPNGPQNNTGNPANNGRPGSVNTPVGSQNDTNKGGNATTGVSNAGTVLNNGANRNGGITPNAGVPVINRVQQANVQQQQQQQIQQRLQQQQIQQQQIQQQRLQQQQAQQRLQQQQAQQRIQQQQIQQRVQQQQVRLQQQQQIRVQQPQFRPQVSAPRFNAGGGGGGGRASFGGGGGGGGGRGGGRR